MHAPKERLRLLALLFVFGLPLAADAADDASAVGAVDRVENEAKIVAGETVTPAKIGTPVHLRDELRTGPEGRLRSHLPRRYGADAGREGERRHRSLCL